MPGAERRIEARVPKVVDQQLEEISKETGRSKSELIREAVLAFIGMYKSAREK
ncbi:hypothetical protein ES703_110884 [subsurface metagenome]